MAVLSDLSQHGGTVVITNGAHPASVPGSNGSRFDVPALIEFVHYVRTTWLEGSIFTSRDISVFGQVIRTNNDVEGWHYRGEKANLTF